MVEFQKIGRLPAAEDNCAIATRTLEDGTAIHKDGSLFVTSHTILEGHRFAVVPILAGAPLLSWGKTFGRALRDILPGEYVCNAGVLKELNSRSLSFSLPPRPNFSDDFSPYLFSADTFQPAPPLPYTEPASTFLGLSRPGQRGVGTRNMIVLLGVNALVSGFVQQLEAQLRPLAAGYDHVDGIVAVTHTEGGRKGANNETLLLRTLSGFLAHPNVAAVLAVDVGDSGVTNTMLRAYALAHGYPLDAVWHHFLTLRGPLISDMARAEEIVRGWLPRVNKLRRSPQPLSQLKIALQCGGSDAFSGISGNPLAALVSKEILQAGGTAVLAETDELIGAESYVLQKVRDAATAQRFLDIVDRFQERAARHGHSSHGNPTGGNKYRGLYNIYLKSLGAAAKRHPDVRLDYVIDYGERLAAPGYYFMDSPGNDLESIAGQVASGCNLIFFVTGNGSITNFPFVPTIKIVTTSDRYALLPEEMDVNAGAYLDGTPLSELAASTRDLALAVASGQRCAGERAGHAQVSIWRSWPRARQVPSEKSSGQPPFGRPLPVRAPAELEPFTFKAWKTGAENSVVSDRVGLILPASLCAGQIARLAAQRLNQRHIGQEQGITRFAALVHTEGCGSSIEPEYVDTMLGYMAHPLAAACLVLEHGCEISHNDFWRGRMREAGLDARKIGWASVQMDGGMEPVLARIEAWFAAACARMPAPLAVTAGLDAVCLGVMTAGAVDPATAAALAMLLQQLTAAGGTAVVPANDPLLTDASFLQALAAARDIVPTVAFAQRIRQPGLHIMATPTGQWTENMAGLGATGAEVLITIPGTGLPLGHPFIPVLQVADQPSPFTAAAHDGVLEGTPRQRLEQLLEQLSAVLSRARPPALIQDHNISFQLTRGRFGVSL